MAEKIEMTLCEYCYGYFSVAGLGLDIFDKIAIIANCKLHLPLRRVKRKRMGQ